MVIFSLRVREGLTGKTMFKQKPEGSEAGSRVAGEGELQSPAGGSVPRSVRKWGEVSPLHTMQGLAWSDQGRWLEGRSEKQGGGLGCSGEDIGFSKYLINIR